MITDPIANLLTQIRNASRAGHVTTSTPDSKKKQAILKVLVDEGYIANFESTKDADGKPRLKIYLRFTNAGKPVVREINRLSKPGRRVYVGKDKLPKFRGGLGVVVVSTSQGMLSDREARKRGLGGELICSVF